MRYTFKVITQISTSRELNRVSPNNIAEQSTRYVNLSKKNGSICQPHWMTDAEVEAWENDDIDSNTKLSVYLTSCEGGLKIIMNLLSLVCFFKILEEFFL